jgi:solute carrier family 25 folate transporter 32
MSAGFKSIYRQDGLRGFYRGFVPSLYGILHGALQFMVYEQLKIFQSQRKHGEPRHQLSNADYLWTSGLSKIVAGAATYPYQVIRSRLQMHGADDTYRSARDVIAQIWRQEGPLSLYKGLGPNLLRVLPSTCITFIVYESTRNNLMAR